MGTLLVAFRKILKNCCTYCVSQYNFSEELMLGSKSSCVMQLSCCVSMQEIIADQEMQQLCKYVFRK